MSRDVIEFAAPAIGLVICNDLSSRGTAFVIEKSGYLLTANHVISRFELVSGAVVSNYSSDIRVAIGGRVAKATIVNDHTELGPLVYDYAILKIDSGEELRVIESESYENVLPGDEVICAGYPLNFDQPVFSKGIVSALARHPSNQNSMQMVDSVVTDAVMQFGSSGGPLLSADSGKVIGINTRKHMQQDELSVLYNQASASLSKEHPMLKLIECTLKFRHLGFHHANAMKYAENDSAYPIQEND